MCIRDSIIINQSTIKPAIVVRDLGVLFDGELSMRQLSQTCFYHLRRIRSVRQQLGRDVTAKLVSAYVLSRLDCCNAVNLKMTYNNNLPHYRDFFLHSHK